MSRQKKFIIPIILVLLGCLGYLIGTNITFDHYDTKELLKNEKTLELEEMDELTRKTLIVFAKNFDTSDTGAINVEESGNIYTLTYDKTSEAKKAYKRYSEDESVIYCEFDSTVSTTTFEENLDDFETATGGENNIEVMENLNINGNLALGVEDHLQTSETSKVYEHLDIDEVDAEAKTKIVVIDSGATGTYKKSYNVLDGSKDVTDVNGHGTNMISIIEEELDGCSYEIIPIKVTNDNGLGTISDLIIALDYASTLEPTIVNMSLAAHTSGDNDDLIREYITKMSHKGTAVIVAAGNDGANVKDYTPANIKEAIVVGACNTEKKIRGFSNWGETVDYLAEGGSTSAATAYVSGIFANAHAKDLDISDVISGNAYIERYKYNGKTLNDERTELTLVNEMKAKSIAREFKQLARKDNIDINEIITLLANSEVNAYEILLQVNNEFFKEFCDKLSDEDLYALQYTLRCEFLEIMSNIDTIGTEADIERYCDYIKLYNSNNPERLISYEAYLEYAKNKKLNNFTVFEDEQKIRDEIEKLLTSFLSKEDQEKVKEDGYQEYLNDKSIIPLSVFDERLLIILDNTNAEESSEFVIEQFTETMKKNFGIGTPDEIVRMMAETVTIKHTGAVYGLTSSGKKPSHGVNNHETFRIHASSLPEKEEDRDRAYCCQHHQFAPTEKVGDTVKMTATRKTGTKTIKTMYNGYYGPGTDHSVFDNSTYIKMYENAGRTYPKMTLGCSIMGMTCHEWWTGTKTGTGSLFYVPAGQGTYSDWVEANHDTDSGKVKGYSTWYLDGGGKQDMIVLFPNVYTVKYNINGGSRVDEAVPSQTVLYNDATNPCYRKLSDGTVRFARTGYDFKGWNTKSDGTGTTYVPGEDTYKNLTSTYGGEVTLYAKWSPKKIQIKYNTNADTATVTSDTFVKGSTISAETTNGIYKKSDKSRYYQTYTYGMDNANLCDVSYLGIELDYYHTEAATAWKVYQDESKIWRQTEVTRAQGTGFYTYFDNKAANDTNVTLLVNWKPNTMKIYYHKAVDAATVHPGSGYDSKAGSALGSDYVANGLYCKDSGETSYSRYYQTMNSGTESIDLIDPTGSRFGLQRTGYHIENTEAWKIYDIKNETLTDTVVDATSGSKATRTALREYLKDGNRDVTLFANWQPNTYTIVYNANGGSGTMANTSATYDKSVTLRTNAYTRSGYTHIGWAKTEARADAGTVDYKPGATVKNLTTTNNGTVTIYAVWSSTDPGVYNITYNLNGCSWPSGFTPKTEVKYGDAFEVKCPTGPTGFTFTGWSISGMDSKTHYYGTTSSVTKTSSATTLNVNSTETPYYFKQLRSSGGTVTFNANKLVHTYKVYYTDGDNLIHELDNIDSTTSSNMVYSVDNGVVTVTGKAADGYGYINARVNLEAGKSYTFYGDTSGTWGGSVQIFLMPNGSTTNHVYISKSGETFTAPVTATYWVRLDVNAVDVTHTFRNLKIVPSGKTNNATGATHSSIHEYGTAKKLTKNGFIRPGYEFLRWSGSNGTNYTDQQSVNNLNATNGGVFWMKAQWNQLSYKITYISNGATLPSNPSSYNVNTTTIKLNNPTLTGYKFKGWIEQIQIDNWYDGFINKTTGKLTTSSTYPDSVYSELIYVKANKKYTISGQNMGDIRWRMYNLDGSYVGNTDGTSFTPTVNGYVRVLANQGWSDADRKAAIITVDGVQSSVEIPKGSTGNRIYELLPVKSWDPDNITINFNKNGGSGGTDSTTALYNELVPNITMPSRTGYMLHGYYDDNVKKTLTYTVEKWTSTARVNLRHDGNTWELSTDGDKGRRLTATVTITDSSLTSAPTVQFNDQNLRKNMYSVTKVTNGYKYTIDCNIPDYAVLATESYDYGYDYRFIDFEGITSSSTVTVESPTLYGKMYYEDNGTGVRTCDFTGTRTLTAHWTPVFYTVQYNGNGATSGSTANTTHVYDIWDNLRTNGYSRAYTVTYNYNGNGQSNTTATATSTFKGWSDNNDVQYDGMDWPSTTFSGAYYANKYSDIMNAFGYDKTALVNHWFGQTVKNAVESRVSSPYFQLTYYMSNGGSDLVNAYGSDRMNFTKHWSNYGYNEGRPGIGTVDTTTANYYTPAASVRNLTTYNNVTLELDANWQLGTVTLPTPTRTGYTFQGWYDAASGGNKIGNGGATYTPTSNKMLYAQWTPINYTITYDLKSGALPSGKTNPTSYNIETTTFTLNNPERHGYTFNGWTGSNGSTPQTSVSVTKGSTGNKSFVANWTPINYTITYDLKGGALPSGKTNPTSYNIETATFTLNNPTRTGYTFDGWTGNNGSTPQTSVSVTKGSTGNKSFVANWTPNIYKVTLDDQGATLKGTAAYWYQFNTTRSVNGETIYYYLDAACSDSKAMTGYTIVKPVKAGYTFSGYWTEKNGAGTQYVNASGQCINNLYSKVADNSTLYAKWTPNTYTLTYNPTVSSNPASYTVTQSAKLDNPSKTGYTFAGWDETITLSNWNSGWIDMDTGVLSNKNTTYPNAMFSELVRLQSGETYTFSMAENDFRWRIFDLNGNYITSVMNKTYTPSQDCYVAILLINETTDATRKAATIKPSTLGNTFTATNTVTDNSYNGFKMQLMSSTGAYLEQFSSGTGNGSGTYTHTRDTGNYQIRFGANGSKADYCHTATMYLEKNATYNFGWTMKSFGSQKIVVEDMYFYKTGIGIGPFNFIVTGSTGNRAYTADGGGDGTTNWIPNTYTVKFDLNKGTGSTDPKIDGATSKANITAKFDTAFSVSAPTREGYDFQGWNITGMDTANNDYNHEYGSSTTKATSLTGVGKDSASLSYKNLRSTSGTVTFTAQWKPITYDIVYNTGGGTPNPPGPTTATFDTAFEVNNLTKIGYTFLGWNISGMDNTKHTYGGSTSTATSLSTITATSFKNLRATRGTVTFNATDNTSWKANNYTVKFDLNKGDGSTDPKIDGATSKANIRATYDVAFSVSAPTREGYQFLGWDIDGMDTVCTHYYGSASDKVASKSGVGKDASSLDYKNLRATDGTVTFTAKWQANKYTIQYGDGYNLITGLENIGSTTSTNMVYSISNGKVTVTGKTSDGYGYTTGRVYLEANKSYTFYGQSSGTWGSSVEAFVMLNGSTANNDYYHLPSNGKTFTPKTTGTYWLRLDVNAVDVTHTFENLSIIETSKGASGVTGHTNATSHTFDEAKNTATGNFTRKYNVTYNYNGNGKANTVSTATATQTGWATSMGGSKVYNNPHSVKNLTSTNNGTVTLYATWTLGSVTHPTPTRTGYTFQGWYDATSGGNKVGNGGATYTPTKDTTLYAQWKANNYTVKFNLNKGDGSTDPKIDGATSKADIRATYDTAFSVSKPTRDGYNFLGWDISGMDDACTHYYGSDSDSLKSKTGVGKDANSLDYKNLRATDGTVTFKAQWKAKVYKVTLDQDPEGSTPEDDEFPDFIDVTFDEPYPIPDPDPVIDGYEFEGWYPDPDPDPSDDPIDSDTPKTTPTDETIYGEWTPITYKIAYDLNDNSGSTNGKLGTNVPTTATFDEVFKVSNPTRTGYKFTGWTISGMCNKVPHKYGINLTSNSTTNATITLTDVRINSFLNLSSIKNETVTFKANWVEITHKIEYSLTAPGSTTPKLGTKSPTNATFDKNVEIDNPSCEGYTFQGWYITGMNTPTEFYHIYGSEQDKEAIKEKTKATVYKNLTSVESATVKFSDKDGDGNTRWTPNQYTVTLDLNDNDGGSTKATCSKSEVVVTFDSKYSMPDASREGYTFTGWYTDPEDGDKVVSGETYVRTPRDHTLYAHWKANTYTVRVDFNKELGSTYIRYDNKIYGNSDQVDNFSFTGTFDKQFALKTPTRVGYTFDGWKITGMDTTTHYYGKTEATTTSKNNTLTVGSDILAFKNLRATNGTATITAQWKANTYTVSVNLNRGDASTVPKIDGAESKSDFTGTFDKPFNLSEPTKRGYVFTAWEITGLDTGSADDNYYHKYGSKSTVSNTITSKTSETESVTRYENLRATSGKVTFTAKWRAIKYTVRFDNSTTRPMCTQMPDIKDIEFDTKFDLPERTYINSGNCFVGWSIDRIVTNPNPSDVELRDAQKNVENLSDEDNDIVVLYPLWTPAPPSVVPSIIPEEPTAEDINPTVLPDGDDDRYIPIESYPLYLYDNEIITKERLEEELILIPIKNKFDIRIKDFDIINVDEIKDKIDDGLRVNIPVSIEVEFSTSNSKVRDTVIVTTTLDLIKSTMSDTYTGYTRYIDSDNIDSLANGSKWSLSDMDTLHERLKDSLSPKDDDVYELEK